MHGSTLSVLPFEDATPREARHRINRMECWLARTSAEHDQGRVLYLRRLFEYAYTPEHADFLEEEICDLRGRARPGSEGASTLAVVPTTYALAPDSTDESES